MLAVCSESGMPDQLGRRKKQVTASVEKAATKLKVQCSPRLRLHLFKRKEVKLILLYNLFISVVFFSIYMPSKAAYGGHCLIIAAVLYFPILGCLADNFFSRYKLVSGSLKWMWVTSMSYCAVSTTLYAKGIVCDGGEHSWPCDTMDYVHLMALTFGIGGFIVNIGSLSMDQLHDASSNEVIAFIVWDMWIWSLGGLITLVSQNCYCATFKLAGKLLLPICTSCALCLDLLFNHWVIKEPPSKNPFKLFLGVLHYAIKNKQPRLRSAFTYWDNKKFSRIDLAKNKYGGPFTTEEVEDVKTFLRMLVVIAFASFLAGLSSSIHDSYGHGSIVDYFQDSLQPNNGCFGNQSNCFLHLLVDKFIFPFNVIFIPVHEFLIYPLLWKYVLQMNSALKFNLFLSFLILSDIILFILEVAGYMRLPEDLRANMTCVLMEPRPSTVALPLTYKWMYFPIALRGLAMFYLFFSSAEFVCTHSPYSLKGLVFRYTYVTYSLSVSLNVGLMLLVYSEAKKWKPVVLGCGAWFYLSVVLLFLAFLIFEVFVVKKVYKTRRRDEDIHNRHIFAINYYSRYVKYNQELESSYE